MFVNIMQFPPVPSDREDEYRQWFTWSNELYANHPGFIRRRLMKSRKLGNFAVLIEHESNETFMAMHTSPTQAAVHDRLNKILDGGLTAQFYEQLEG